MILEIFILLMIISLFLIGLGYAVKESVYTIIGFLFLFFLGVFILWPGLLQVQTGQTEQTTYTYEEYNNVSLVNFTSQTTTYNYEYFDDDHSERFGIFLTIIGAIGLIVSYVEIRRIKKDAA